MGSLHGLSPAPVLPNPVPVPQAATRTHVGKRAYTLGRGWGGHGGPQITIPFCFPGVPPESPMKLGQELSPGPSLPGGREKPGAGSSRAPLQTFTSRVDAEAWRPSSGSQQAAETWCWGQGLPVQVMRCAGPGWGSNLELQAPVEAFRSSTDQELVKLALGAGVCRDMAVQRLGTKDSVQGLSEHCSPPSPCFPSPK